MSDSTSTRSIISDPLLLRAAAGLFGKEGMRQVKKSLRWSAISGFIDGLGLISLLPIATALATGTPAWGLTLRGWLVFLVVISVVGAIVRYHCARVSYAAALVFMYNAHEAIGNALASLPLGWFRPGRTGGLSRLVSDGFMAAGSTFAHIIGAVLSNGAGLLVILVGSWVWNPALGLTLTIAAPISVAILLVSQRIKRWASGRTEASTSELASRIVEYSTCQPALRAAGRAASFAPLTAAAKANDRARFKEMWWSILSLLLNSMVVQALTVAIITVAGMLATSGQMGSIETIAFIGITLRFMRSLNELNSAFIGADHGRPPLTETKRILDEPAQPQPTEPATLTAPGRIEFDQVNFGYSDQQVLRQVSFVTAPGTMTALVGPSGSGKTTIARLIARFWDVDCGAVRVGGVDVREQTTEQLMSQLSMVFQDVYLFDDTLEANIRVGAEDASAAQVRAAADLAGVTAIAQRLPGGWETRVGEGGRSLSGGERQRVSIARALLKNSPIVLFDEATSALDAENEANVLASVNALRSHSTFVVIAHKLDTIRSADQIIFLDGEGRVAECGTHEQLYAAGGGYRAFCDHRQAALGWALQASEN